MHPPNSESNLINLSKAIPSVKTQAIKLTFGSKEQENKLQSLLKLFSNSMILLVHRHLVFSLISILCFPFYASAHNLQSSCSTIYMEWFSVILHSLKPSWEQLDC
uniref:Uncharacterized protein n=1 Tax=Oryza nivara TaxID=4536 RepID=A0A0E0FP49_ORYNI